MGPWITGSEIVLSLAKERGSATSASGMAMTKVGTVVAIVISGAEAKINGEEERDVAYRQNRGYSNRGYGHQERRGYGSCSYLGGYAEREIASTVSGGNVVLPIPPSYRPGANTRRMNSVTLETRTAHWVMGEETVQEPDGTMYPCFTSMPFNYERVLLPRSLHSYVQFSRGWSPAVYSRDGIAF